ncbi:DUF1643 domain-containing protein [Neobacillus sp. MM2021_6]|uniref:DUF1643 domain-containing protein n=1 Tax=Bacillaceae TaxID=186817 RepID=UPI00140C15D2|nr:MULTISPECIES: DUF1643 domain-containing protein [Bacillaceae]MBO0959945.1 DUF1643 domain-containing protein [Neobacillus sp. MM2021_6]NHC18894.1 DUF1643 domain-containing protein [Bacillus sp. MM2020_4]
MNNFKAYGTFYKSNDYICRKAAFLQFGISCSSIGSTIMLNPGKASFIDQSIIIDESEKTGEVLPDKTMKRLAEILQNSKTLPLEGRFHIYNLFPLQNTSSKDAVRQKDLLMKSFETNQNIIQHFQEENHPWVLLAWSTEEGLALQQLKSQWIAAIHESNVKVFGLKANGRLMYYHPYPRIPAHRENYFQQIVQQLQMDEGIVI